MNGEVIDVDTLCNLDREAVEEWFVSHSCYDEDPQLTLVQEDEYELVMSCSCGMSASVWHTGHNDNWKKYEV